MIQSSWRGLSAWALLLLLRQISSFSVSTTDINISSPVPLSIATGGGQATTLMLLMTPAGHKINVNLGGGTQNQFCDLRARNCLEVKEQQGHKTSGVYTVAPYKCCPERLVQVYCDMEADGGGWTVIQRRDKFDQQEDFYRTWTHYVNGFGNLTGEFWLGLDHIHAITNQTINEARFDLGDFDGNKRLAKYDRIHVGDSKSLYKLELGAFSGDAGDAMEHHNGRKFSTMDKDNDDHSSNCAAVYKGAWWYGSCHNTNLNGEYLNGPTDKTSQGIIWEFWRGDNYSLKMTEIKVRPRDTFAPSCQRN
ncbi:techylectin-5B [Procambarus clarkii]|uniref:techylectin-5B n=1 Tax=Procambarus clarkii TaxID=6728 RepID=UPI00374333C1